MKNPHLSAREVVAELRAKSLEYGFWAGGVESLQLDSLATWFTKPEREVTYRSIAEFQAESVRLLEAENSCSSFLSRFGSTVLQRVFFDSPWSSRLQKCHDWLEGANIVWTSSETLWPDRWIIFLEDNREAIRGEWMSESERKKLEGLPIPVTIYRGYNKPFAKKGFSWSLSETVARKMPTHRFRGPPNPWIVTAEIIPSAIIAYLDGCAEQEVVASPNDVKVLKEARIITG